VGPFVSLRSATLYVDESRSPHSLANSTRRGDRQTATNGGLWRSPASGRARGHVTDLRVFHRGEAIGQAQDEVEELCGAVEIASRSALVDRHRAPITRSGECREHHARLGRRQTRAVHRCAEGGAAGEAGSRVRGQEGIALRGREPRLGRRLALPKDDPEALDRPIGPSLTRLACAVRATMERLDIDSGARNLD
jgi:hypothetical protein